MNCYKDEQIFDYINDEVSSFERIQIEKHIQICPDCRIHYKRKREEINLLVSSIHEFDKSSIDIPEFLVPEQEIKKLNNPKKTLIFRLSVAATILVLISVSILFLTHQEKGNIDFQQLQNEQSRLITDMNESWHNRDLIFTQINTETGETEVHLVSNKNN